jgi:hypothetical protein
MITNKPDIFIVLEREGIELQQRGRFWWACCPFHDEKTPSFAVNPDRQTFNCYGCGEHGDILDFIIKHHRVNFKEALIILGMSNGIPAPPDPAVQRRKKIQRQYSDAITVLYDDLCQRGRKLHKLKLRVARTPALTEAGTIVFAQAMGKLAEIDYKLDILLDGTIEDQVSLLKEISTHDSKNTERRTA